MIPRRINGATHCLGKPVDWDEAKQGKCYDLWIRVVAEPGGAMNRCESAWEPTPDEIEILKAGGSIIVSVVGGQPPIWVSAEPMPEEKDP